MGKRIKLTAADLDGMEELGAPPPSKRLSPEEIAGAQEIDAGGFAQGERPEWLTPGTGYGGKLANRQLDASGKSSMEREIEAAKATAAGPSLRERAAAFGSWLGSEIKEAPESVANDPMGAARAVGAGMKSGATMGLLSPENRLQLARESWVAANGAGSPDAKRRAMEELQAAQAEVKAVQGHQLARVGGEFVGFPYGAGGAISRKVMAQGAPTVLDKVGRAVTAGATSSAVEGTGRALTSGKSLGEAAESGLQAAGTGGVLSGGLDVGSRLVGGALRAVGAPEAARGQRIRQLTKGADPTHARRLAGVGGEDAAAIDAFVERNPTVAGAVGNPEKVMDATEAIVARASAQTGPVYGKLDATIGKVPVKDIVSQLDDKVAAYAKQAGHEDFRNAIKEVRDNVIAASQEAGVGAWSHQDLRDWVTRVLKKEQRTVGSLAQTQNYEVADAVHQAADKILKQRLKVAAVMAPELAPDLKQLSAANADIAMALKVRQAAENAIAKGYYGNQGGLADAVAAGAGASALGAGGGVGGAVTGYLAAKVAPNMMRATGRAITRGASDIATGKATISPSLGPAMVTAGSALRDARRSDAERDRKRAELLRARLGEQ